MEHPDIRKPSEGEEFIIEFFREIGLKYEREKPIPGLTGDLKEIRKADFYLPKFDSYVEFYGLWNKNVKDDDYRLKKEIYRRNAKACVYLYPENLGFIHFAFDKRLQKALIENGKYKELLKYRRFKFFKARYLNLFGLLIGLIILFFSVGNYYEYDQDTNTRLTIAVCIIAYNLYRLFQGYIAIFIKNKFSLLKVMQD